MEPVRKLIEYLAVALPRSEDRARLYNPVQINSRSPGPAGAERIPGSMLMREVEADDFPETGLTSIPSVQSRKPTR